MVRLLLYIFITVCVTACGLNTKSRTQISARENLEIPVSDNRMNEVILNRKGFTISYNTSLNIPNWVAWELNADKLIERESRTDKFIPDPDIDSRIAITTNDYKHSGWDRGHMCPAGDNRWHWQAMNESFYMTNICPQNHNLNRGDWTELEEACRTWAAKEPVYIVCGPITYKTPKYGFVGTKNKIRVPDEFFKVVLTGIQSGDPKAIGFLYKNESGNNKRDKYVNSVDQIERITQLDFFSKLPDEIENEIEKNYNLNSWN